MNKGWVDVSIFKRWSLFISMKRINSQKKHPVCFHQRTIPAPHGSSAICTLPVTLIPRIWRIWRRSWRLRQRGWWIQVLQVQQVFIGNRSRRWRGPSLSQTWLSSKSDLSVFTRFGHFARECREEEDRCYKCHGNFLNWAHESTGWFSNHSPFPLNFKCRLLRCQFSLKC